jgi:hypothetical protein
MLGVTTARRALPPSRQPRLSENLKICLYAQTTYGGFRRGSSCATHCRAIGYVVIGDTKESVSGGKGALSSLNSGDITAETRRSAEVHREIKREEILKEKAEDAEKRTRSLAALPAARNKLAGCAMIFMRTTEPDLIRGSIMM